MAVYLDALRQCVFIPAPTFTEKELPDQSGRVFIVTGGYAGVGKELSKMLYLRNGTVYIAGRTPDKAAKAMDEIKAAAPTSQGRLEFLQLDLADLATIKASAQDFVQRERRLDVLTNNAGVMVPPVGSKSVQGHELQMGTNCLGPWLFAHFLTPLLKQTAASSPPGSVRVTWAGSLGTMASPTGGVAFDSSGNVSVHNVKFRDYAQSKAGNVLLAQQWQALYGDASGVVSNAWNPGNLQSELQRHSPAWQTFIAKYIVFPSKFGGYTELFAGWAPEPAKPENRNKYIGPWGRFVMLRPDIGRNGEGEKFWQWCEKQCQPFM
ncbi:NAD(P)-binding protein [Piedraia hortae CBS 480.64]|uniref:NAD(P)-binding protein n=1 Tax=Piedraia hortae CBS 480.64 TaxID=1314780 RepID=A0A6A7C3P7_9PEZI|nr:NAD(P)-binding protein [Piedraia hortae CBS 480.64]